jgi:hypothetical protein
MVGRSYFFKYFFSEGVILGCPTTVASEKSMAVLAMVSYPAFKMG